MLYFPVTSCQINMLGPSDVQRDRHALFSQLHQISFFQKEKLLNGRKCGGPAWQTRHSETDHQQSLLKTTRGFRHF